MTKYKRIVFLQGEDADEVLKILTDQGKDAAFTFLKQWDYGEDSELFDESSRGTSDRIHTDGDYIMNYNHGLNYIGLEEVIKDEVSLPYKILDVENYFDQAEACYTVCVLWHEGQDSLLYELQCRIDFKPGHGWNESDVESENEYFAEFESYAENDQHDKLKLFVEELEHYQKHEE